MSYNRWSSTTWLKLQITTKIVENQEFRENQRKYSLNMWKRILRLEHFFENGC